MWKQAKGALSPDSPVRRRSRRIGHIADIKPEKWTEKLRSGSWVTEASRPQRAQFVIIHVVLYATDRSCRARHEHRQIKIRAESV